VDQLHAFVLELAHQAGMEQLPVHELAPFVAN
jgi:hypothetical protein